MQIESPMRILHATKANGTNTTSTVGPCIHSTCSGQNSIELGSVPKISTLIFALKLSPFHARNAFYRVKNREILNATNAPHALPTSLFTRETFLSGFHLENHFWFLENFDLKNSQTFCGIIYPYKI